MRKALVLVFAMLISMGAMAQKKDLLSELKKIDGLWSLENKKVVVNAIIENYNNSDIDSILQISTNINDTLFVNLNIGNIGSDEYMDNSERKYSPECEMTIYIDTCIHVKVYVDDMISKLNNIPDCKITDIYPINTDLQTRAQQGKIERIITNEAYIFIKTINKIKREIYKISQKTGGNVVFSNNYEVPFEIVENNTLNHSIYQEMTSDDIINNINEINISLKKFSRMQVGGEIAMIAGTGITIVSSFVHINKSNADKMINAGMVIGGVTTLTGYIVKLCAYKHTNKIQIQGSSIVYKF